jgi:hypothetical protein
MTKLLIDEPPLQVLPSLAVEIGLCEAIIIQQIHYWLQRTRPLDDGYCWVYNTVKEWQKQFPFWSINTINRHLQTLRESGVLLAEQKSPNSFDKTLYYRINYEKLGGKSITPKRVNRKAQNELVTIYTETTRDYFNEFWQAYPKKVAKESALKAWNQINIDEATVDKILKAIKDQDIASQEQQFIPYPATWLNNRRWEDEVDAKPKSNLKYYEKGYQP